ncbi:CDP-alcohol phosphatidyltransferase family protein [Microbacterium arabinogalactanolyticum]|uniref:Phosphatidylcholine synthase n=1 Tax=Microbacterium arabinogalactanolyticum TaxID=69365 RepID=A0ABQ5NCR0_9MICO|nr:CDP-alcohol phosphatidyltransferase family protein [Microbacterium arabinogalactanolyticum]GLC83569.1 phosphatidylcholine synthase [Microbacterium arabinogalactanolyticum]
MSSRRTRVLSAWAVHAFTLTGVLWATLALLALFDDDPKLMWLYLGIALVVDGVDGTLARKAEVRTYAPHFDGVILDSIIDYLTWTLIPALFLFRTGLLGEGALAVVLLLLITVSSMFCYANTKMKTGDYYFLGFPAAWNVVALAIWLLDAGIVVNAIIVVVLALLTWAPIAFVHPLRVARFRTLNIIATAVWILASAALVIAYPTAEPWIAVVWLVSGAWVILTGIIRTVTATRALR